MNARFWMGGVLRRPTRPYIPMAWTWSSANALDRLWQLAHDTVLFPLSFCSWKSFSPKATPCRVGLLFETASFSAGKPCGIRKGNSGLSGADGDTCLVHAAATSPTKKTTARFFAPATIILINLLRFQ